MNGKPEENKIREAFEEVRLPEGAKERMYANILRKAELAKTNASSQTDEASQQHDAQKPAAQLQDAPRSATQLQEMSQASSQIAQQAEMREVPQMAKAAQPKRSMRLSWRKYASLAACLVIFIAAGAFLPGIWDEDSVVGGDTAITPPASEAPVLGETPDDGQGTEAAQNPEASDSTQKDESSTDSQDPQTGENSAYEDDLTFSPSPFEDVTSAGEFSEKLGFSIDAPDGAKDISYSVAFGETAIVDFSFENHAYTYYASKKVEDISTGGGSEDALSQAWEDGGINYLLLNSDGASKAEFEKVASALQNS